MFSHIRHRCVRIYQSYFPRPLTRDEHVFVAERLSPYLHGLFSSQPLCDQRHGLLVYAQCQKIFGGISDVSDDELLYASLFHDVAKKDCRFNVTQRIIAATFLGFIGKRSETMRNSSSKFLRRVGIYADHAQLSWDLIAQEVSSQFVHDATVHHHLMGDLSGDRKRYVELFVEADTL